MFWSNINVSTLIFFRLRAIFGCREMFFFLTVFGCTGGAGCSGDMIILPNSGHGDNTSARFARSNIYDRFNQVKIFSTFQ